MTIIFGGIFGVIIGMLDAAEEQAFTEIATYLAWAGANNALTDEVAETVYNILNNSYNLQLNSVAFKEALRGSVENLYKAEAHPRINFNIMDRRAMVYLERSDLVYLGKFVGDPQLKQNIIDFLKDAYIKGGRAIGNSPSELRAFMEAFKEQVQLNRWQARRLIDTTVARARNIGHIVSYRQAAGKTFKINGPRDNVTCEYCRLMIGRTFSVALAVSDLDKLFSAGPEGVNMVMPFLKGSITLDDLKSASDEDLQGAGLAVPPYHPHCRHFTTLVDTYEDLTQVPYSIE